MRHVADTAKLLLGGSVDLDALRQAVASWETFRPLPFRRRVSDSVSRGGERGGCVDSGLSVPGTSTNGEILKSTTKPHVSAKSNANSRPTWLSAFGSAWRERFAASPHWGQLARAINPLVTEHGEAEVLRRFKNYLLGSGAQYASPARFAITFGAWTTPDPDAWRHDRTAFRPGESQDAYIARLTSGNGR